MKNEDVASREVLVEKYPIRIRIYLQNREDIEHPFRTWWYVKEKFNGMIFHVNNCTKEDFASFNKEWIAKTNYNNFYTVSTKGKNEGDYILKKHCKKPV